MRVAHPWIYPGAFERGRDQTKLRQRPKDANNLSLAIFRSDKPDT
jgi:hypothetical protein